MKQIDVKIFTIQHFIVFLIESCFALFFFRAMLKLLVGGGRLV